MAKDWLGAKYVPDISTVYLMTDLLGEGAYGKVFMAKKKVDEEQMED